MKYILHGMRFKKPIEVVCDDIEEAVGKARSWLPVHYSAIGFAYPLNITDENGSEVVSEKELDDRIYD